MKLHKLPSQHSDYSYSHVESLAEKYLGGASSGQIAFGRNGRKGGKYPPSRDGEFRTMVEQQEFQDQLLKGGHGVPLTSQSISLSLCSLSSPVTHNLSESTLGLSFSPVPSSPLDRRLQVCAIVLLTLALLGFSLKNQTVSAVLSSPTDVDNIGIPPPRADDSPLKQT